MISGKIDRLITKNNKQQHRTLANSMVHWLTHQSPLHTDQLVDQSTHGHRSIDPSINQSKQFIKHHISQIRLTVLHRQKRTYLSTKQTRCHPYKYHKPATVQCHTKLCRNRVNIWLATDDPLLEHEDVLHAIWNINTKSCNWVVNSNIWNC